RSPDDGAMNRERAVTKRRLSLFDVTEEQAELSDRGLCSSEDSTVWLVYDVTDHHRTICGACPVAERCLEYALAHEANDLTTSRIGIYNATSPKERLTIAR